MRPGTTGGRPRGDPPDEIKTLLLALGVYGGALWIAGHFVNLSPLAEAAETAEPAISWIGIAISIAAVVIAVFVYPVYLRHS